MQNVIVFVEHKGGSTRKVSYELATEARAIADKLGGKAHAVVVGPGSTTLAETLKTYPLDVVHVNDDADVEKFLLDPIVDYVEAAAKAVGPSVILFPNTMPRCRGPHRGAPRCRTHLRCHGDRDRRRQRRLHVAEARRHASHDVPV
jgi:electron transfer flavoprotein alpha subunit